MMGSTGFVQVRKPRKGEKLRPWVKVRSTWPADAGIEFEITRLLVDDTAELRFAGDAGALEGDVIRPIADLRRIPDPRKGRPPIEGMPATRPTCGWCGRKLSARLEVLHQDGSYMKPVISRRFLYWAAYEGVFCTSGCAIKFAGASYRGGFRRKRA